MNIEEKREKIIAKAMEYIDTPYHHQSRLKGVGIDCAGLIVCVLKDLNEEITDLKTYSRLPNSNELQKVCDENAEMINFENAKKGDVLLITFIKNPQHLAFLDIDENGNRYMIHAYGVKGVEKVVRNLIDDKWENKIVCAYKLNYLNKIE